MIGLICIDVDGTLVGSSGEVSPAVWAAAADARSRGIRLAICTGRPGFGRARGYAERLDADGWHVFQNGASVLHLPRALTRSRPLPPAAVAQLVMLGRRAGRVLELYTDTEYAVELDTEGARQHAALLGIPFRTCDLLTMAGPIVRAQWLVAHDEVDAVFAEPHEGLNLSHSLSPMMPEMSFINVTPAGVDKARALRVVAGEYGVPLDRVMMVGDSANDVTAMQAVGVPVAMGNAEPVARAAARHVVGDVDDDGLVDAFALATELARGVSARR